MRVCVCVFMCARVCAGLGQRRLIEGSGRLWGINARDAKPGVGAEGLLPPSRGHPLDLVEGAREPTATCQAAAELQDAPPWG